MQQDLLRLEFVALHQAKTTVMTKSDEQFRVLYEKYRSAVITLFMRFGFEREKALDLSQDTFLRVYGHMSSWRREAEWGFLKTTAQRIALNEVRRLRAQKRGHEPSSLEALTREPAAAEPHPEGQLLTREEERLRIEAFRVAISKLQPRLRSPLLLRLEGMKYQDIALRLRLSLDTVKTRLHEAKILLQRNVDAAPEELEDHGEE